MESPEASRASSRSVYVGGRCERGFSSSSATGEMVELGSASSASSPLSSSASSSGAYSAVFYGYPLISAVLAFAVAQSAKIFTTWYNERRWDAKQLIGSGGMPSSHSATVVALAVAIGIQDGLGSSSFATATILAAIVICDASGVRLHAGRQAKVLNQIVYELPTGHPLSDNRPLRELLGHTPLQVTVGAVLGSLLAIGVRFIYSFIVTAMQSGLINKLIDDH